MSGYIINDYIFNIDDNMVNVKYSDNYETVFLVNNSLREYLQLIKTEIDNYQDKYFLQMFVRLHCCWVFV